MILDKDPKDRTFDDLGIEFDKDTISDSEKQPFKDLIELNSDMFALTQKEIGKFNLYEIDLEPIQDNPPPIKCKVYAQSTEACLEVERQVKELLEAQLIIPSDSPYAIPCFLVKKADKTQRLVYDCRVLNKLLKDKQFLNTTIQECIEKLSENNAKFFIKLDLKSAFNHLVLTPQGRLFSSFKCRLRTFSWTRCLFGNKTSPSAMNKAIGMVLMRDPLLIRSSCSYVDDILLFSSTLEGLLEVLKSALKALRETGFKLNPGKCSLIPKTVEYCGYTLNSSGITINPQKLDEILKIETPRNKKELKRLLGGLGFFRSFLPGFPYQATILQQLLKSTVKFRWNEKHAEALKQIKESLKNVAILGFPDQTAGAGAMVLQTDATLIAVGGFISQESRDGQSETLLACYGRSLRENERKWAIGEIEILSVLIGLEKFRHLLIGRRVVIKSDSKMVRYLNQIKLGPSARQTRWLIALAPLLNSSLTSFHHVTGKSNVLADYLSRRSYPEVQEI